jgi:hypothetical protein
LLDKPMVHGVTDVGVCGSMDVKRAKLTRFWIPFLIAAMTADSGNGSFGFGPDFATFVMSARIAWEVSRGVKWSKRVCSD